MTTGSKYLLNRFKEDNDDCNDYKTDIRPVHFS